MDLVGLLSPKSDLVLIRFTVFFASNTRRENEYVVTFSRKCAKIFRPEVVLRIPGTYVYGRVVFTKK